ncbi:hypothetical protein GALMADRAFT_229101 [Galerina marginata CBS 339.88]|uniref:Uncharacterized protein n=1 Tax=Galerina marginata (strain CBS 339.88) TaxID=685588 RepID=A0A067SX80_GALM3|nr:hypothetical protein GALMADRAFT_229101 [Galerina marginata CBS 339.88]
MDLDESYDGEFDDNNDKDIDGPSSSARYTVILTLCLEDKTGLYPRSVVRLPESFEAAVDAAKSAFKDLLPSNVQDIALGLPLAVTYNNFTQWVRIPANEWRSVVPPGKEVGVFINGAKMDDFPYVPKVARDHARSQTPPSPKLFYITYANSTETEDWRPETHVMVTASTLEDCRAIAASYFESKYNIARPNVKIEAQDKIYGENKTWILVTDSTSFNRFTKSRIEPIKLRASFDNM